MWQLLLQKTQLQCVVVNHLTVEFKSTQPIYPRCYAVARLLTINGACYKDCLTSRDIDFLRKVI